MKKFWLWRFYYVIEVVLKVWCCLKYWWSMGYVCKVWGEYFGFVLPLKIQTITKYQCPFFDNELLRIKLKKRKAKRKYKGSKTSVLKSEYGNVTHMYSEKFLEKRRLYIENVLMENCSRKMFATLKLLLGQDVKQHPENKKTACKQLPRVLYIQSGKCYCIDSHCDRSWNSEKLRLTQWIRSRGCR